MLGRIANKIKRTREGIFLKKVSKKNQVLKENSIGIFADPRGGSTWITQIIASIPGSAVLWEPFWASKVPEIGELNFAPRQYIPESAQWPNLKSFLDTLLSGRLLTSHLTVYHEDKSVFQNPEQLIIKFARGNALLPWYVNQYNLKYKPIYFIRHPFAVVSSQLRSTAWSHGFDSIKIENVSHQEYYDQHKTFLDQLKTKHQVLTAIWCLSNAETLKWVSNNSNAIKVNYEALLEQPSQTIEAIFANWELAIPNRISDQISLASKTASTDTPLQGKGQLEYWKNHFSVSEINEMQEVLTYFEVEEYSKDSIFPKGFVLN